MRVPWVAALGLAAVWAQAPRDAVADERMPAVRLAFTAPTGCPDAADFLHELEVRGTSVQPPAPGDTSPLLRVEIEPARSRVVGHLAVIEPTGQIWERTIVAANCRAATDALALIVVLALERSDNSALRPAVPTPRTARVPSAASAPPPPLSAAATEPAPLSSAAPSPSATTAPPLMPPTRPAPSASTSLPPTPSTAAPRPSPYHPPSRPDEGHEHVRAERSMWSFSAAASGFMALGMAPEPVVGWTLLAGLAIEPAGWLEPALLRVGVADVPSRSFSVSVGSASFSVLAGLAEICPASLRLSSGVRLIPCVVGEYGEYRASGPNGQNTIARPWAGAGIGTRLSLTLFGPISFDASAEGIFTLDRDRFEFETESVYETPLAVARLAAGIGFLVP